MKKIIILCAATITLAACSSKENTNPEVRLNETNLTLKSNDTHQLTLASGNPKDVSWTSNRAFVATVSSSGVITAERVGEAIIRANNAECRVKVTPRYTFLKEPEVAWGMSKSDIVNKYGRPTTDKNGMISYMDQSNTVTPLVIYNFDSYGKLKGSGVLVSTSYTSQLSSFLMERYAVIKLDPDGDVIALYGDDLTEKDMRVVVGIEYYNNTYWMLLYIDAQASLSTKSIATDIATQFHQIASELI